LSDLILKAFNVENEERAIEKAKITKKEAITAIEPGLALKGL
jgi:hypothetical protein